MSYRSDAHIDRSEHDVLTRKTPRSGAQDIASQCAYGLTGVSLVVAATGKSFFTPAIFEFCPPPPHAPNTAVNPQTRRAAPARALS